MSIQRITKDSPRLVAMIAGGFYVVVFVLGIFSLFVRSPIGVAAGVVAGLVYIAVTMLFYYLFKPVNRKLSLLAAIFSLFGIAVGPLSFAVRALSYINPLIFFGLYCLLIAYLILKSTFLPRVLGVLMAFAGLGWLTFLWPQIPKSLGFYIFIPGIIGEGALTLWLLILGVDEQRWKELEFRS
jgi:hypothetical protein